MKTENNVLMVFAKIFLFKFVQLMKLNQKNAQNKNQMIRTAQFLIFLLRLLHVFVELPKQDKEGIFWDLAMLVEMMKLFSISTSHAELLPLSVWTKKSAKMKPVQLGARKIKTAHMIGKFAVLIQINALINVHYIDAPIVSLEFVDLKSHQKRIAIVSDLFSSLKRLVILTNALRSDAHLIMNASKENASQHDLEIVIFLCS